MSINKQHHKCMVLSDLHLGARGSKAREVVKFLKHHTCDTLILNGDIIDGWQLKKSGNWRKRHTRFFRRVLKMVEKNNTRVVYTRGNHDDFLDHVIPFQVGMFSIRRDYIYKSNGKRYLVVHGDIFDSVTSNMKWLALLGDVGYNILLYINKRYNARRAKKGLPYYSLSQKIKAKVKYAVNFISDFEKNISDLAKINKCDGVICGHIHTPALKQLGDILYLNSGDWVETMSALVEDYEGNWRLIYYTDEPYATTQLANSDTDEDTDEDIADDNELTPADAMLAFQPVLTAL